MRLLEIINKQLLMLTINTLLGIRLGRTRDQGKIIFLLIFGNANAHIIMAAWFQLIPLNDNMKFYAMVA